LRVLQISFSFLRTKCSTKKLWDYFSTVDTFNELVYYKLNY